MPSERGSQKTSRRKFLKATSAAALTAGVAGCSGGGDGTSPPDTTTGNGGTTTTTTDGNKPSKDQVQVDLPDYYPYASGQTAIGKAKQVMEEAGYGPNNRFDLSWLQYSSPTWKEMAKSIRARLDAAYIDMDIASADFASLLSKTEKGAMEAYTLGWIADYPSPQNFIGLVDPINTLYGDAGKSKPNGMRIFWSEDSYTDPDVRQYMIDQFNRIQNNPQPTKEARQIRYDATVNMEEGIWESACCLPIYHPVEQPMWYDNVDYKPYGAMGSSRAKMSEKVKSISGKNRVDAISGSFSSVDPIAAGNTESGEKVQNIFDAPMHYNNGTTNVVKLLVESWDVNDDLTTYSLKLKEGVQFQDGWGEVTADDMVYSLRRLIESPHSTNLYFPISVMGIKRDTKTVTYTTKNDKGEKVQKKKTVTVPGSAGVRKTGEYSIEIELEAPFSYALSVLAYSAFSAVPENIVGDIKGYEGKVPYEEFANSPVGSGPFEFVSWEPGNGGSFRVDTFDNYHGDKPTFDGVDWAIITKSNASYNYFLEGGADIGGVPTQKYDPSLVNLKKTISGGRQIGTYGPMADGDVVNMAEISTISTYYVAFNMEKVPRPVRRAMAYVINRPQFMKSVFKGRGQSAFHLCPPTVYPGGAKAYRKHWQK